MANITVLREIRNEENEDNQQQDEDYDDSDIPDPPSIFESLLFKPELTRDQQRVVKKISKKTIKEPRYTGSIKDELELYKSIDGFVK